MMRESGPLSLKEIVQDIGANEGYLKASLDMLLIMEWLRLEGNRYLLTERAKDAGYVPAWLGELYEYGFSELLTDVQCIPLLQHAAENLVNGWGCGPPLCEMLDGTVLIPIMVGLTLGGLTNQVLSGDSSRIHAMHAAQRIFLAKKWANRSKGSDCIMLTSIGKFMLARCMICGVAASYRPMLASFPELLFGDGEISTVTCKDIEKHVERTLNIQSSGFQHEKFFRDMEESVASLFEGMSIQDQPDYIADMGCGDGTLLKRIFEVIRNRTERGERLKTHPVTMIGFDLNTEALEAASVTLKAVPHKLLLYGNVGEPERISEDLKCAGVKESKRIMHVRSFLDHNRSFKEPNEIDAVDKWKQLPFESYGIGENGTLIHPAKMMQSLSEHLGLWSRAVGKFGLLVLEVHVQTKAVKQAYFDIAEGFHFDALHAFSRQYLCESHYFLAAMAENGLIALDHCRKYPRGFPYARITLGHFVRKPYRIQFAHKVSINEISILGGIGSTGKKPIDQVRICTPELCFVIRGNLGTPLSAVFCSWGEEKANGKRTVILEDVYGDQNTGRIQELLGFLVDYLTLMDNANSLHGKANCKTSSFLCERGVRSIEGKELTDGDDFVLEFYE